MVSSPKLIFVAGVSQLVFLLPAREGKDERFQSIQGDLFSDPWIFLPNAMNTTDACSPGFSSAASAKDNAYSAIVSATIELFSSY